MLFLDRLNYGDEITRNEFTDLFTSDPEFALSFLTTNNPVGVLSNLRRYGLISDEQQVYPSEVWNFVAAYLNSGRNDTARALFNGVAIDVTGEGMSEAILDALIGLEVQFSNPNLKLTSVAI